MAAPTRKSFSTPDEHIDVPGITADVVEMADSSVSRSVFQPGTHCPQISIEGRPTCMAHHTGYAVDGELHIEMVDRMDGSTSPQLTSSTSRLATTAGPPGIGRSWPCTGAASAPGFRSAPESGPSSPSCSRILWVRRSGQSHSVMRPGAELLAEHYRTVRGVLDRYRGREVSTAGDGFFAAFDGAARAIHAAIAIRDRATRDGLSIRAGVHSGEVEIVGSDVRGVTVHEAARIAAAAEPDEILVSEATRLLSSGAPFEFDDRGPYELKGLPGARRLSGVRPLPPEA